MVYNYLQQVVSGLSIMIVYKYYIKFVENYMSKDSIDGQR